MLHVDTRWGGDHGIGRFSREVTTRLTVPFQSFTNGVRPSSPLDVASLERLRLRRSDVLYSPSYNCGPTRALSVVTIHDLIHLDDPAQASLSKRAYYELIVKPTVKKAGVALTVSEASKMRIQEWLGDDSVEIRVVGNGSSEAFGAATSEFVQGRPRFLYVGNLRPHKNVPVLMEALKRRPEYSVTLVTPDSSSAMEIAAKHGVTDQVSIANRVDDVELANLYRGATATLFPSVMEGFGFPALESFLCATPVIYWAGCRSIADISNGSGFAVESASDPEAWATAMDIAAGDRQSLLSEPAAEWRARFNWDSVAIAVDDALTSVT